MSKQYKALIVDDERLARNDLRSLLSAYGEIDVVGESANVAEAIQAIVDLHPDVIFLDIQMPGETGFDLLERVDVNAKIIFVTAFDEYAIRAFEINALDYLLKPVNPERLSQCIERLHDGTTSNETVPRDLRYNDRLFLTLNNQLQFLKISSIAFIAAAGDYSEVFLTPDRKYLATKTMKEWENRLPSQFFTRIHRSTIVNLEYVDRLDEWFNYSYRVFVKGFNNPLTMSRRYVAHLKEKMG